MEYAILAFFCGLSAGVIGKLKGSSFFLWFLVGLVLPVLGTLAAIFFRSEREQEMRTCRESFHQLRTTRRDPRAYASAVPDPSRPLMNR